MPIPSPWLLLLTTTAHGCLRDSEGHLYAVSRAVAAGTPDAAPPFVYETTRVDGRTLRVDQARIAQRAGGLAAVAACDADGAPCHWSSLPGDAGSAWTLDASDGRLQWAEAGLFTLDGRRVGAETQGLWSDKATFSVARRYDVSGCCEGFEVKGVLAIEQCYSLGPRAAAQGAGPAPKPALWASFKTVYRDGSIDAGAFLVNPQRPGSVAFLTNERGQTRVSRDVVADIEPVHGRLARVIVDGSQVWAYTADPQGVAVDGAVAPGCWTRVGDPRQPARWFGRCEVNAQAHGSTTKAALQR